MRKRRVNLVLLDWVSWRRLILTFTSWAYIWSGTCENISLTETSFRYFLLKSIKSILIGTTRGSCGKWVKLKINLSKFRAFRWWWIWKWYCLSVGIFCAWLCFSVTVDLTTGRLTLIDSARGEKLYQRLVSYVLVLIGSILLVCACIEITCEESE